MTLIAPGSTAQFVDHGLGRLRVLHAGEPSDKLPLVLIHGGGSDHSGISWYRLFEPLSADREVWAVDLPGFGGSTSATAAGGADAMADVVAEVLADLEVAQVIAIGVSMGGDIALNLALRHPELVAGLIAIAAGGLIATWNNPVANLGAWAMTQTPDFLLLPAAQTMSAHLTGMAARQMVHDPDTIPAEVMDEFERQAQEPGAAVGYVRYNQASAGITGMRNNLLPRVHEITVPALFFHGSRDPLVPIQGSQRAVDLMPRATMVTAAEVGHWAQLEAHDLFLDQARTFLAQFD